MALKCFPKGLVTGTPPPKLMAEIQSNKTSRSSRAGDTYRSISTPKGDIQPANQTEFSEDDILELSNYLDDIYNNSSKFTFLLTALFTRFVTLVLSVITFLSEISQCRQVDCKTPGDSLFIEDILKLLIFRNSKAITVINTLPASFLSYMDILWSNIARSNAHSESRWNKFARRKKYEHMFSIINSFKIPSNLESDVVPKIMNWSWMLLFFQF